MQWTTIWTRCMYFTLWWSTWSSRWWRRFQEWGDVGAASNSASDRIYSFRQVSSVGICFPFYSLCIFHVSCVKLPWRCWRTIWMWHWGMWLAGMVGRGRRLNWMILVVFSNLNDAIVLIQFFSMKDSSYQSVRAGHDLPPVPIPFAHVCFSFQCWMITPMKSVLFTFRKKKIWQFEA